MNPRTILIAALALAGLAAAQSSRPSDDKEQERLAKLRTAKLAKPVFQKATWVRDYDRARELAAFDGKFVLVYFTRSHLP